ncbi:MAG: anti-sigma factor antagonist [bacterium]|nr:anti-sigma factor antagonist [bacterium]MCY3890310.1 anti-sigma factor antagonist [bacterium]MCY3962984.1 anti-sigma factor antagonist [bacterium]MCY4133563.1 anti-sigma factor antagonist [bacterium]
MLEIEVENLDTHTVLRPQGEIDAYTVAQFRERIGDLALEPRLLIDLGSVPFMDSAGLGALIGGIRRIRDSDGEVVVACGEGALARLLHTTGFDRIVPVAETPEEALTSLLDTDSPEAL